MSVAGDDQPLGRRLLAHPLDAPLDGGVHELGEEARVRVRTPSRGRRGPSSARSPSAVVAGAQVAVLRVGLADGVAQPAERGVAAVRRVHDQGAARPRDARQLGARTRASSGTCSSMSTTATRSNSASAKGRRSPVTWWTSVPTSSRMEATASGARSAEAQRPPRRRRSRRDDAVVGPEVEAAQPVGRAEHGRDLGELALLQHRAAEERQRPRLGLRVKAERLRDHRGAEARGQARSPAATRLHAARRATPFRVRGGAPSAPRTARRVSRTVKPFAANAARRPRRPRTPRTAACRLRRASSCRTAAPRGR